MIHSSLSVHNPSPQEPPTAASIFELLQRKISKNEAEKQKLEKTKNLLQAITSSFWNWKSNLKMTDNEQRSKLLSQERVGKENEAREKDKRAKSLGIEIQKREIYIQEISSLKDTSEKAYERYKTCIERSATIFDLPHLSRGKLESLKDSLSNFRVAQSRLACHFQHNASRSQFSEEEWNSLSRLYGNWDLETTLLNQVVDPLLDVLNSLREARDAGKEVIRNRGNPPILQEKMSVLDAKINTVKCRTDDLMRFTTNPESPSYYDSTRSEVGKILSRQISSIRDELNNRYRKIKKTCTDYFTNYSRNLSNPASPPVESSPAHESQLAIPLPPVNTEPAEPNMPPAQSVKSSLWDRFLDWLLSLFLCLCNPKQID